MVETFYHQSRSIKHSGHFKGHITRFYTIKRKKYFVSIQMKI